LSEEKAGLQFTGNSGYSEVFIKIFTIKKYSFIFEMYFKGFPGNKSPEIKIISQCPMHMPWLQTEFQEPYTYLHSREVGGVLV
jgi:hypothetical protein